MLQLYAYNAGKGDCIRIRFAETHNIIIDSGVIRFAPKFNQLCSEIITSGQALDASILTHVDEDHIGGFLANLHLNSYQCPFNEVWMNYDGAGSTQSATLDVNLSTRQNNEVAARLKARNVPIRSMHAGDRILLHGTQLMYDSMVMESLTAAYYFLGIQDATDENGKIPDMQKIDRKALYKARECYLTIRDKADELYWSGTMRRMGLCVYNTFFFLQDNYRVLTIYQDIKKYLPALKDDEWRDVEMKYARISAQKGEIDTSEFNHITTKDRVLLDAQAKASRCANLIEDATANVPRDQLKNLQGLR